MSRPNTISKKPIFILFINDRLVQNDKIKKTLDNIYTAYQPKGGYSYFTYITLYVRPDLVDVNVHPTKK